MARSARTHRRRVLAQVLGGCAALVVVVLGAAWLFRPSLDPAASSPGLPGAKSTLSSTQPAPSPDARTARQLLDQIPVRGRAAKTGYQRSLFGNGWASVAGCDVRNRILARDLTAVVFRPGTRDCVVLSGTLLDPYTGESVVFVRGNTTSTLVQIDHRVPLVLAWQQGAQQWTAERRRQFANDPDNLVAVQGHVNQAKGASGPGSWLPPARGYRCRYVIAFVQVTARYALSLNPGDRDAAVRILDRC